MSDRIVDKIKSIGDAADRPYHVIFSFCLRHALFIGAYKAISVLPVLNKTNTKTLGLRLPRKTLRELSELAWEQQSSIPVLCDYLCGYSLAAKSTEEWVQFFQNGDDIVFDFWMYIHLKTECPNSNRSYPEPPSTTKLSNKLQLFAPPPSPPPRSNTKKPS